MIEFFIPGKPVPKARPRLGKHGVYTPAKTKAAEELIRNIAAREYGEEEPVVTAVKLAVSFAMPVPKSWPKQKRFDAFSGEMYPLSHPDLDNMVKTVSDALNGVIYVDDSQIVELRCQKAYMAEPGTYVTVRWLE